MRLRTTLACAGAFALATSAIAQDASFQPITSQVKDAGTYHLATGTWSRNTTASVLVGPSALYDNSCTVGYYTGLAQGDVIADSGRLPSTSDGGLADLYTINCFSLAYCTFNPSVTTLGLAYYDCHARATASWLRAPRRPMHSSTSPAAERQGHRVVGS